MKGNRSCVLTGRCFRNYEASRAADSAKTSLHPCLERKVQPGGHWGRHGGGLGQQHRAQIPTNPKFGKRSECRRLGRALLARRLQSEPSCCWPWENLWVKTEKKRPCDARQPLGERAPREDE